MSLRKRRSEVDLSLRRALRQSEVFHGFAPRVVHDIELVLPKALYLVGLCAQVDYVNDKWDGRLRRYWHEFDLSDKRRPCLLFSDPDVQADGSRILIVKGHFNIKPEGIIG